MDLLGDQAAGELPVGGLGPGGHGHRVGVVDTVLGDVRGDVELVVATIVDAHLAVEPGDKVVVAVGVDVHHGQGVDVVGTGGDLDGVVVVPALRGAVEDEDVPGGALQAHGYDVLVPVVVQVAAADREGRGGAADDAGVHGVVHAAGRPKVDAYFVVASVVEDDGVVVAVLVQVIHEDLVDVAAGDEDYVGGGVGAIRASEVGTDVVRGAEEDVVVAVVVEVAHVRGVVLHVGEGNIGLGVELAVVVEEYLGRGGRGLMVAGEGDVGVAVTVEVPQAAAVCAGGRKVGGVVDAPGPVTPAPVDLGVRVLAVEPYVAGNQVQETIAVQVRHLHVAGTLGADVDLVVVAGPVEVGVEGVHGGRAAGVVPVEHDGGEGTAGGAGLGRLAGGALVLRQVQLQVAVGHVQAPEGVDPDLGHEVLPPLVHGAEVDGPSVDGGNVGAAGEKGRLYPDTRVVDGHHGLD